MEVHSEKKRQEREARFGVVTSASAGAGLSNGKGGLLSGDYGSLDQIIQNQKSRKGGKRGEVMGGEICSYEPRNTEELRN